MTTKPSVFENDGLRWFIITGAARSGTTILSRMLNTHPNVGCFSEIKLSDFIGHLQPLFSEAERRRPTSHGPDAAPVATGVARPPAQAVVAVDNTPQPIASPPSAIERPDDVVDGETFTHLDAFYAAREHTSTAAYHIGDGALHAPSHASRVARALFEIALGKSKIDVVGTKVPNIDPAEAFDEVSGALPNLSFIHIVRRPSDVVNSSLGRRNKTSQGTDEWHIQTVEEACSEWIVNWNWSIDAKKRFGNRILFVKYEDLITRRQGVLESIASHLGVESAFDTSAFKPLPKSLQYYAVDDIERGAITRVFGDIEAAWNEPVEVLIDRFESLGFPLSADGILTFGGYGNGHFFGRGGFSGVESWGQWTDGPVARFSIVLGSAPGDISVTIHAHVWPSRSTPASTITLTAGSWRHEISVANASLNHVHDLMVVIPREALDDASRLDLDMHLLELKGPHDEPVSDRRKLGLGLRRMEIAFMGPEDNVSLPLT